VTLAAYAGGSARQSMAVGSVETASVWATQPRPSLSVTKPLAASLSHRMGSSGRRSWIMRRRTFWLNVRGRRVDQSRSAGDCRRSAKRKAPARGLRANSLALRTRPSVAPKTRVSTTGSDMMDHRTTQFRRHEGSSTRGPYSTVRACRGLVLAVPGRLCGTFVWRSCRRRSGVGVCLGGRESIGDSWVSTWTGAGVASRREPCDGRDH